VRYYTKFTHLPELGSEGIPDERFPKIEYDPTQPSLIPQTGDLIELLTNYNESWSGTHVFRVKDRMFSYGENGCIISIFVEDAGY
jgi:hypothetical protein